MSNCKVKNEENNKQGTLNRFICFEATKIEISNGRRRFMSKIKKFSDLAHF